MRECVRQPEGILDLGLRNGWVAGRRRPVSYQTHERSHFGSPAYPSCANERGMEGSCWSIGSRRATSSHFLASSRFTATLRLLPQQTDSLNRTSRRGKHVDTVITFIRRVLAELRLAGYPSLESAATERYYVLLSLQSGELVKVCSSLISKLETVVAELCFARRPAQEANFRVALAAPRSMHVASPGCSSRCSSIHVTDESFDGSHGAAASSGATQL